MHDPFPFAPPPLLTQYVQPVADYLSLPTLPLHYHEILFAFSLYHLTNKYLSPAFSRFFFPRIYPTFSARTKLNWDVHIVSFVQSTLINSLALYVMWKDEERSEMNWQAKVWGYTGSLGLIQGFAAGYFVWDLMITLQNIEIFGPGMLAHAVSALFVFCLGFRPFVNFYGPTFILYELSSPFLNIHWFCDKLNLTGSKIQLYNGVLLLITFFSCRLCWGTYQSVRVYYDVYRALTTGNLTLTDATFAKLNNGTVVPTELIPQSEIMLYSGERTVPLWLAGCYLLSNLTLNGLNWYWFGKMIETIRKRFDPPLGSRRPEEKEPEKLSEKEKILVEGIDVVTPGVTPGVFAAQNSTDYISAVHMDKKSTHLEVQQSEVRLRTTKGGAGNGPQQSGAA